MRPSEDVRQGKVFDLELGDINQFEAERLLPEIAGKVLANVVIEKYSWQILED